MLNQPKDKGGINFPILSTYFHATQVGVIMKWMNKDMKTKQKLIEKQSTLIPIIKLPHLEIYSETYQFDKVCIYLKETASDPDFLPNKMYTRGMGK